MKKYEWMRNDTTAIMFSAIDDNCNSRIFRISAVFKDEAVNPERLERAVKLTMPRYPICMYRNILRLENFVNRISDMQRLDEMKVCIEETDVNTLFEALKENAAIICKDKNLSFTTHANCKTILTDAAVLEQIIIG